MFRWGLAVHELLDKLQTDSTVASSDQNVDTVHFSFLQILRYSAKIINKFIDKSMLTPMNNSEGRIGHF